MTSDELLLKKRLTELAEKAYGQGTYTFSNFLGLAEQDVLNRLERDIHHVPKAVFGGADGCQRVMVRFGDEDLCGYDLPFPIVCLQAAPTAPKYADKLTHRDLLGALMNLGITREQVGDIILRENVAYIFATEKIAPFIADNLTKAKHTQLTVTVVDELPEGALFTLEPRQCVVSSERIDGVVAHVYKYSRSQVNELFRAGKIFLNGRCCENTSTVLKEGDTISVRGEGRFIYRGVQRSTKSGNLSVEIDVYV
ncbi:MAG: DbpA RNA binding domain-containing protein [Oscillospiraceae bacterium]|nr:DbpA RNA binding domain-containing protein [Oscillospiraceae bacterium]